MRSKMRTIDKTDALSRRNFLIGSAGAVTAIAVAPIAAGTARAAVLKNSSASALPTLVRMARDLYPHDRLADGFYETAVVTIDGQLDGDLHNLLSEGASRLNTDSLARHNTPYAAVEAEADRVALLESIEATPFFKTMRSGMITALYNQPELWRKLGYEGSSAEMGGYLHRGFDDLDWLPA